MVRIKQLVYEDESDEPSPLSSDLRGDLQSLAASAAAAARSARGGGPNLSADERELCTHYREELLEAKRAGEYRFVLDLPPRHALLFLYEVCGPRISRFLTLRTKICLLVRY